MYRACISASFLEDKSYRVHCFIQCLDLNYDNVRDLLNTNALDWLNKPLNQVIQLVTDTKLNKKITSSWIIVTGNGTTTGKQGVTRPATI